MFESNFPVDKASCSYTVLWNALKRVASSYTEAESRWLLHDTAAKFYRLDN
jgi:predicted TIM-barrel fold metal-dependent hydrolase